MFLLRLVEQLAAIALVILFMFEILIPIIAGDPTFPSFRRAKKLNDLEDDLDQTSQAFWRIRKLRTKARKLSSTIQKENAPCPPKTTKPNSKPSASAPSPEESSSDSSAS